jgi:hypothetical protein
MESHQEMPPLFLRFQFERALFWLLHSPLRITTAVVLFGASASFIECLIHLVVRTSSASPLIQAFADSIILGIFASCFGLLVLTAARDRRHKLQDDLRRIAELNHQVRNSLQIIVYEEYFPNIAERRSAVLESVGKIEGTLRELFPLVGERSNDRPWEAHNQVRLQAHQPLHERRRQSN